MLTTFTARAQLAWNETPKGVTEETVKYSPAVYPASNAVTDIYQRAIAPQLYLYHNIRLNDRQNFYWNLTYDYARNVYRRSYAESTLQPVTSNAKENYHMLDLKLNYVSPSGKATGSASLYGTVTRTAAPTITERRAAVSTLTLMTFLYTLRTPTISAGSS